MSQEAACLTAPFAVKIIEEGFGSDLAKAEIDKLKRFEGEQYQQRLIRLLCSFEYNLNFYLVFPWADANLEEFWRDKFPDTDDLRRGCGLARWVAGEMLGLARGLHLIHNPPPRNSSDGCIKGRHGDIKPENILWFRGDSDPELNVAPGDNGPADKTGRPTGMLKICDFGLVDFHRKASAMVRPSKLNGRTHAYCAPECESLSGEYISPSYDSWSLGCVLLQFVTWYAQGWDGIEQFADKRRSFVKEFECGDLWEGMFFCRDRLTKEVSVKAAVHEVSASSAPQDNEPHLGHWSLLMGP